MRFFFDNTLPPRLAEAIHALIRPEGHEVAHLRDRFAPETKDPDWISALAREGDWTIVSGDPRITKGRHERAAWIESGQTAFFLKSGWTNFPLWEQVWRLVRYWPEIARVAAGSPKRSGFLINVNGKIEGIK